MNKIAELPFLDRPREKAFRYGIDTLTDAELLAIIIGSGSKGYSSLNIAHDLLNKYINIYELSNSTIMSLTGFKGIDKITAIKLQAVFEFSRHLEKARIDSIKPTKIDSYYIYQKYAPQIAGLSQEVMILIILDRHKNIIHEVNLYKGTNNHLSISFKEIFRKIILYGGEYFYIIHNHPNNSLEPSGEDIFITGEISKLAEKMDVKLLDHIIIATCGYYSFQDSMKL